MRAKGKKGERSEEIRPLDNGEGDKRHSRGGGAQAGAALSDQARVTAARRKRGKREREREKKKKGREGRERRERKREINGRGEETHFPICVRLSFRSAS